MTSSTLQPNANLAKRMSQTQAINLSLRAFVAGLFGPLPVVGLIGGTFALICWGRVQIGYSREWNPASRYLTIGVLIGLIGLAIHLFLVLWIVATY